MAERSKRAPRELWGVFSRPSTLTGSVFQLQAILPNRPRAEKFATQQREATSHTWERVCDRYYVSEHGELQKVHVVTVGQRHRPDPDQPLPEAVEYAWRRINHGAYL